MTSGTGVADSIASLEALVNCTVAAARFHEKAMEMGSTKAINEEAAEYDNAKAALLSALRRLCEERDDALQNTELMAKEWVYQGNSVQWWWAKATAYKKAIGEICDALTAAGMRFVQGKNREINKDCTALVNDLAAERDSLKRDAERYRWLRNLAWGEPTKLKDVYNITFPTRVWKWGGDPKDFSQIDAAIDAALRESNE